MVKEGEIVKSIHVHDLHQDLVDLMEKYKGKPILIIIYNNQCLGCTGRAIPLAFKFQQENKELQVLGVHTNFNNNEITENEIKSIFTIKELPFPIYIANGREVYDQFQSSGTPQWILIERHGVLFRSIFGSQEGAQNRLMYSLDQLI